MSSNNIEWNNVIKKEARGIDDADFGEVQEVGVEHIVTQKGILDKDKYYIPKNLVDRFEDGVVYFSITNEEAKTLQRTRDELDIIFYLVIV